MTDRVKMLEKQVYELKQELAEARRTAKPEEVGGYTFTRPDGSSVSLSDLFGDHDDLLVIHNMGKSCVYCTLWADGFNGLADHLQDRCAFVLTSPNDPATVGEFSASRDWAYPCLSHQGSTFAKDMGFEPEPGKFWPGVSAFHRNADGSVVRTGRAQLGPGDDFCSLWHLFDLLADGPGEWKPKYTYSK